MDQGTGSGKSRELGGFFALSVEQAELYIRHLAWLSATPDGQKRTRYEQLKGNPLVSVEPDDSALWVVSQAMECGLSSSNGFGASVISWQEIEAWANVALANRWTQATVRKMSEAYVRELHAAKDIHRQPPIVSVMDNNTRAEVVSRQFHAFIKAKG